MQVMFEVLEGIKSGSSGVWIGLSIGLVILFLKIKWRTWLVKQAKITALMNWNTQAVDKGGARIVGSTPVRVVKNPLKDTFPMLIATLFSYVFFSSVVWFKYDGLLAGRENAWAVFVAVFVFAAMFSAMSWVLLTQYQFDEIRIYRKRLLWWPKAFSWGQVVEVLPLHANSVIVGSRLIFEDKTVFRIPSKMVGYRELMLELSKTNLAASNMVARLDRMSG